MKVVGKFLLNAILCIWQLPQSILGSIVVLVNINNLDMNLDNKCVKVRRGGDLGIPFFGYLIVSRGTAVGSSDYLHEAGHRKLSLRFGPAYLLILLVALVWTAITDILYKDEIIFIQMTKKFNTPWERAADKLGGVNRIYGIDKRAP